MKKISDKYNEACIKVFDMLKLLSNGTARYIDTIELFTNEDKNENAAANVILNKYLNTLKIFGININKTKNIYYLQNSFFSINLDENDAKAFCMLKASKDYLTSPKQQEFFDKFLRSIEMRLTKESKELLEFEDKELSNINSEEYLNKYRDIISKCETCCFENQKLELCFIQENKDYKVMCSPREITFKNGKAYLSVFNHLSRQVFEVAIDTITSMKQMPVISKGNEVSVTVVYKIGNALAKSYCLKEWETCDGKPDENGWLTIINHNEDFDELLKRLLRYGSNCVVLSPKNFRESMITAIDNALKNYE